jgi:hypothetical protein
MMSSAQLAVPPRVARRVQRVAHGDEHRKGAHQLRERVVDLRLHPLAVRAGDQVDDDLAVDGALEERPLVDQPVPQLARVRQVAVVHQRQVPLAVADADGLGVLEPRAPGGGVADVPHGHLAGEPRKLLLAEDLGDQPGLADPVRDPLAGVERHDPGRLLPAVLQRVQPQVGQLRGLGRAGDRYDSTHVR